MPDAPHAPLIRWDTILNNGGTGDLFLFHGDSWISWGVEVFSAYGPFSHITMMVKHPSKPEPWLWQANPTLLANSPYDGPDTHHAITPKEKDGTYGAQIGYLDQALNTLDQLGDMAYYRQLIGPRSSNFESRVTSVMQVQDGTPFGPLYDMMADYEAGSLFNQNLWKTDIFFCSKLVAYTYQQAGALATDWVPNSYAPNDFDLDHKPDLAHGFVLGPLFKVDMSTVPGHRVPPSAG